MYQFTAKLAVLLACSWMVLSLGGCAQRPSDETSAPKSAVESSGALSAVPSAPDVNVPEDTTEVYDAYFSTERQWKDVSLDYQTDKNYDGYYYFIFDPILDQNGDGFLYKAIEADESGELLPYEEMLKNKEKVLPDSIGSYTLFTRIFDRLIFVVDGTTLIESDLLGGDRKTLYESSEPIKTIIAGPELVYFEAGNTIYRCYRPTGTTDQILTPDEKMENWHPSSNLTIIYGRLTEAGKAYRASGIEPFSEDAHDAGVPLAEAVAYNAQTGQERVLTEADYDQEGIERYPIQW